jgi:hypothetical protein
MTDQEIARHYGLATIGAKLLVISARMRTSVSLGQAADESIEVSIGEIEEMAEDLFIYGRNLIEAVPKRRMRSERQVIRAQLIRDAAAHGIDPTPEKVEEIRHEWEQAERR